MAGRNGTGSGRSNFPTGWDSTDFHNWAGRCLNHITTGRDGAKFYFCDGTGRYIRSIFFMTENDDMHKTRGGTGFPKTQFQTLGIVRMIYFQPEHGVDQLTKCEFPTTPNPTAHLADMEGLAWLAIVETERGAK